MKIITCLVVLNFITTQVIADESDKKMIQVQAKKLLVLEKQFQALAVELIESKSIIKKLEQQVNKMGDNTVLALDNYLQLGYKDGYPVAVFSAINLQVNSGAGRTDSHVNGLGNMIIGYNEKYSNSIQFCSNPNYSQQSLCTSRGYLWGNNVRRGSHNLIVGANNSYDDFGSIIAGVANTSNANYSSIVGGLSNYTAGNYSNINGGRYNETHSAHSSISGGYDNITNGKYSSITGGRVNTASGEYSSVTGGQRNTARGEYSSVTSGSGNQANADGSSVTGGQSNIARGFMSTVSGGAIRRAEGFNAWQAGGLHQDE